MTRLGSPSMISCRPDPEWLPHETPGRSVAASAGLQSGTCWRYGRELVRRLARRDRKRARSCIRILSHSLMFLAMYEFAAIVYPIWTFSRSRPVRVIPGSSEPLGRI